MQHLIRQNWLAIALSVLLLSCAQLPISASDNQLTIAELRAAPTEIVIDGQNLHLETEIWRDFQPISPPDGKPAIAVVKIATADKSPLKSAMTISQMWILNGDRQWIATPTQEQPGEFVARDGPKWETGASVDVVAQLVPQKNGDRHLLQAKNQTITRTD